MTDGMSECQETIHCPLCWAESRIWDREGKMSSLCQACAKKLDDGVIDGWGNPIDKEKESD